MDIDRAALTDYLTTRYGPLALAADMTTDDEPEGWEPVLDAVQAVFDLAVELSPLWTTPLARYHALDLIVARLGAKMDVSIEGDSYRLQQLYKNASELLAQERASVAWIVNPVPATAVATGAITSWRSEFLTGSGTGGGGW